MSYPNLPVVNLKKHGGLFLWARCSVCIFILTSLNELSLFLYCDHLKTIFVIKVSVDKAHDGFTGQLHNGGKASAVLVGWYSHERTVRPFSFKICKSRVLGHEDEVLVRPAAAVVSLEEGPCGFCSGFEMRFYAEGKNTSVPGYCGRGNVSVSFSKL